MRPGSQCQLRVDKVAYQFSETGKALGDKVTHMGCLAMQEAWTLRLPVFFVIQQL